MERESSSNEFEARRLIDSCTAENLFDDNNHGPDLLTAGDVTDAQVNAQEPSSMPEPDADGQVREDGDHAVDEHQVLVQENSITDETLRVSLVKDLFVLKVAGL